MATIDEWFDQSTLMELVPVAWRPFAVPRRLRRARCASCSMTRPGSSPNLAGDRVVDAQWSLDGEQPVFACSCGEATERPCEHLIASALST